MSHQILVGLSAIVVLGITAQWLAWRLRLPSILFLLGFGLLAGPGTGWLDPDQLLGPLLLPVVSLSVAVILFEGGLSLDVRDLRNIGGVFFRLTTLGVLVSWVVTAIAARFLLQLDWSLAALLGAILVVTGPTVIGPLLRHLRLEGQVGSILRWEGILIDPVGAMLAVLVFAAVRAVGIREAAGSVAAQLLLTAGVGIGLGMLAAVSLVVLLRRYWIPDSLQNAVSLATVFAVFALADHLQRESGLLAVTVMGIALANQRQVTIRHVVEFKENLSILLVSGLFIILAARLDVSDLQIIGPRSLAFLLVLILIARPASVWISTAGSKLSWRERLFIAWMAPRGIVAAAVTSVFALELGTENGTQAAQLLPITFLVIIGTVLVYGLSASPLARWLDLADPEAQGVLIVGAHRWARVLAAAIQEQGFPVLLVDSSWPDAAAARRGGLPTHYGSILAEQMLDEIEFAKLGKLVALTPNDEVNSLACLRFIEYFGRREVYQLPFHGASEGRREAVSLDQRGRFLFASSATYSHLTDWLQAEAETRATPLTKEFDYEDFRRLHGEQLVPVFLITEGRKLVPITIDEPPTPQPGQVLISIAPAALARPRPASLPHIPEEPEAIPAPGPVTP